MWTSTVNPVVDPAALPFTIQRRYHQGAWWASNWKWINMYPLSFSSDDRLLFITLIPDRNGGKCPFEDSITAERERGVCLWQAQIEWAICRTNWCLKSLQDLIGLKEGPGNGWCAYLRRPRAPSEHGAGAGAVLLRYGMRLWCKKICTSTRGKAAEE